jgi:uncharacterized protein YbjT (DUF2867 family)
MVRVLLVERGGGVILVAGATGELGGRALRLLCARGEQVRGLVRPSSDTSGVESAGAEVVRGTLGEPEGLAAACAGVGTVICTATAIARELARAGGGTVDEVDGTGVGNLIQAADRAGVERFVYVSYAGVEAGLGFPLERAKLANERRLEAASMRRVVVRPDAFQELHLGAPAQFDIAGGKVGVLGRGDTRRRFVATDDIAALLVELALEAEPPELIEVGGPEALSKNEAIAFVEQTGGRRLKRQRLPRPLVRVGMHLLSRPRPALGSVFGLGLLMDLHEGTATDDPLRQRGIEPRSATTWLRQQLDSGVT